MRVERWYWLVAFCFVSLCVHLGMTRFGPAYVLPAAKEKPQEMEVALQPIPEPKKKPEPKPVPQPKPVVKLTPKLPTRATPRVVIGKRAAVPVKPSPRPIVVARKTESVVAPKQPQPINPTPKEKTSGGIKAIENEKPIALGAPTSPRAQAPSLPHLAVTHRESNVGGGAPAPSAVPDGKGGASGPEAPPEEVLYNGGGKGGKQLPKEAPAIGGGGGASILSVNNPLAKDVIAEDRPGAGPGIGGNVGTGAGGGVGFARGKGIGTNPSGRLPIASLSTASGNGNSKGSGAGTRSPGGGHGTGSDLPGTGGEGLGYGRGKGVGIGSGNGASVGEGAGGSAFAGRGSPSFGDIGGLLAGDQNGGGGRNGGIGGRGAGASNAGSFGSKEQIPFALKGDIYYLDPGTPRLPSDFKRLQSVGSIYTPSLNIPTRRFDQGFPGVTERFEWFAIDYNGVFRVGVPARYRFRLISDDGSKLFIDSKLVIDNDGTHGARMREGSISLTPGKHTIEVQYFQGPRYEVALVLDVKAEAE